jgi:predicted GNAT family acetyltransferase
MRKLRESERPHLLDYLMAEPEINMFFIGVIENHCIDSDEVTVFAEEAADGQGHGPPEGDAWDIVILKYYDNYILYSHGDNFNLPLIVAFLKSDIVDSINGKATTIRRIAPFFPHLQMEEKSILRLDNLSEIPLQYSKAKVRILTSADAKKIIELYAQNKHYAHRFSGNKEKHIAERRASLEGNGIAVGLIYKQKLVSVAEISADNDVTGLLVGIATHPKYYGRGFATQAISALCAEAFSRGKKHICVLHDECIDATNLLKNVGFEEKNHYALLH